MTRLNWFLYCTCTAAASSNFLFRKNRTGWQDDGWNEQWTRCRVPGCVLGSGSSIGIWNSNSKLMWMRIHVRTSYAGGTRKVSNLKIRWCRWFPVAKHKKSQCITWMPYIARTLYLRACGYMCRRFCTSFSLEILEHFSNNCSQDKKMIMRRNWHLVNKK